MSEGLIWEHIEDNEWNYTMRAKVPGGWMVCINSHGWGVAFVPDKNHKWKVALRDED